MEQDLENARFDEVGKSQKSHFASELTDSHTQPRANIPNFSLKVIVTNM